MSSDRSVVLWIEQLREGDPDAAQRLWESYFERLIRLARRKLQGVPSRAYDAEDLALSAIQSFCGAVQKGRYPKLEDRDDLWQLLVMHTGRKAIDRHHYERAKKRGGGKVRGDSAFRNDGDDSRPGGIDQVIGGEPTPEFAASVAEECGRLLDILDAHEGDASPVVAPLREVALLKMQGHTIEEIAEKLGCVPRTINRKLMRIRCLWGNERRPPGEPGSS